MRYDVCEARLTGQHCREHDPVIVAVRLGAKHRDAELAGRARQDFLDGAHAGHTVANDNQALARPRQHVHRTRPDQTRAAPCASAHVVRQCRRTPLIQTNAVAARMANTRKPAP